MSTVQMSPAVGSASKYQDHQRLIKLGLFLVSLALSAAAFLAFDYFYSEAILTSYASSETQGYCFSRDLIRHHAFQPNCSCVRPWLRDSFEFVTNSLGFRDEAIRQVPMTDERPRILVLGDSATQGMIAWDKSYIGRIAAGFPQYDFLNGAVEGYSPSNYLNTARFVLDKGIEIDEVIVFLDISDVQDEAAFFHDIDASGAVGVPRQKRTKSNRYSDIRLRINQQFLITNDIMDFFERSLVRLGAYYVDQGHGGNELDLERSAWTYRRVSETDPYETGYAPLGVEGGIAREKEKMTLLWQELGKRNIPLSVVVYPWPAQVAHDTVDSKQVRIWREWCEGKCKRFISLFPAFAAVKEQCPPLEPGCWYLDYFMFGDTHYSAAGDALFADVVSKSLVQVPAAKRQAQSSQIGDKGPDIE